MYAKPPADPCPQAVFTFRSSPPGLQIAWRSRADCDKRDGVSVVGGARWSARATQVSGPSIARQARFSSPRDGHVNRLHIPEGCVIVPLWLKPHTLISYT